MSKSNNKWGFNCLVCQKSAYLPLYIKNGSLFSGMINNPTFMSTQAMIYSRNANKTTFSLRRETRIIPISQRAIPVLSNQSGNSQTWGST